VLCRLKPDKKNNFSPHISLDHNSITVNSGKSESATFTFDNVLPISSKQEDVYELVQPMINDSLIGYNATIFTYGQTGSGKTYTMHGTEGADRGIIPRVLDTVLAVDQPPSQVASGHNRTEVTISCLEIYQEKLSDLLVESGGIRRCDIPLRIRQQHTGEVWVEGLTERTILTSVEFEQIFSTACKRRAVGAHSMNTESSRSHFCCTLRILRTSVSSGEKIASKIHLIDLAGSEMVRKTSAQGCRLNEAKYINKSLSALGNVINALTCHSGSGPGQTSSRHVPFRDSKLTRFLQDSLSGNAKTMLVLTVSSAIENIQETIATLRFGERARKLRTVPKINTEKTDACLKKALARAQKQLLVLNATIDELRQESCNKDDDLLRYRKALDDIKSLKDDDECKQLRSDLPCANCALLQAENARLTQALHATRAPLSDLHPRSIVKDVSALNAATESSSLHVPYEESRCGVCGMNERETEMLNADTGEHLGGYFSCDGNCGMQFHVRCAGEVGEGGQYVVPVGEWYCTACSVADDALDNIPVAPLGPISPSPAREASTDAISKDDQIARLQAEYHAMRRERNRVLNQWQHEQRLAAQSTKYRLEKEREQDEEIIAAKEIISKLQDDVLKGFHEQNRLKKLLDDLVMNPSNQIYGSSNTSASVSVNVCAVPGTSNDIAQNSKGTTEDTSQVQSITSPHDSGAELKRRNKEEFSVSNALLARSGLDHLCMSSSTSDIPKPWLSKSSTKKTKKNREIEIESRNSLTDNVTMAPVVRLATSPIRKGMEGTSHSLSGSPQEGATVTLSPAHKHGASSDDEDICTPSSRHKTPFNKRLKKLLKSVQEETGSFAEIRQRYRDRETERSMLKSRGVDRQRVVLSSSLPAI